MTTDGGAGEPADAAEDAALTRDASPTTPKGRGIAHVALIVVGTGLLVAGLAMATGRTVRQAAAQGTATAMLVACAVGLVVFGAFTWGQFVGVSRFRHMVAALTDPTVLERYTWRDSAKIALRTVLLAAAGISLAFDIPAADGTAWGLLVTSLKTTLAIVPLAAAGLWLALEATPLERPANWPTPSVDRPRYAIVVPVVVVVLFMLSAFAAALWPGQGWLNLLVGAILAIGIVALPYALALVTLVGLGARLGWKHARHAARRFDPEWNRESP